MIKEGDQLDWTIEARDSDGRYAEEERRKTVRKRQAWCNDLLKKSLKRKILGIGIVFQLPSPAPKIRLAAHANNQFEG